MFKKGFSKILIIVVTLVIIAGGVLTWQYWPEFADKGYNWEIKDSVIDEIVDWQTYRNDEWGFEIKYPTGSEFGEESDGVVFIDTAKELQITIGVASKSEMADIFGNFSTITEAKTNFEKNSEKNYNGTEAKIITINGQDVLRITIPYESVGSVYTNQSALLSKGEQLFWMRQKYAVSPNVFNQMLSTFKFLN